MDNWFSNFKPMDQPLTFQNISYSTVEHFYQAMKTLDVIQRQRIAQARSGSEAKRLGRQLRLRSGWEFLKFFFMESVLKYKFKKGTSWYNKLMSTGESEIIEMNNWHDNEWGNCVCPKCKDIPGQNHLGKLLMKIRNAHIVELHMQTSKPD